MATLKAPFGWVGGKSKLANSVVEMLPKCRLYVEVFGGALNVLYAKPITQCAEVVNDTNGELINLHRIIQTKPESLSAYLNSMLISREVFENIKKGLYKPRNNIERGAFYFYQLSQSFGAKGDNFAMSAKNRKPKSIYKSFQTWSNRLKFVTIENLPFQKLIKNYDSNETIFYCDPPYLGTEDYYKDIGEFNHIELANMLKGIQGKFLLSYNDCEQIRELYKGFEIIQSKEIEYTLGKNVSGKTKTVREIFIKNY